MKHVLFYDTIRFADRLQIRGRVFFFCLIFSVFCACDTENTKHAEKLNAFKKKEVDSLLSVWRSDSKGCLGIRQKMGNKTLDLTDMLFEGMEMSLFFQLFGRPDKIVSEFTDKFGTHRVYNFYTNCKNETGVILIVWEKNNKLKSWSWVKSCS